MTALNPTSPEHDAAGRSERPSKTALKKAMQERQALGEALLQLPESRLDALALPEPLREALAQAQRTRSHEGRRRQLQYVGKLMGKADAAIIEQVREAVAAFRLGTARDALALHEAERWRAELIADDASLTRWASAHPQTDMQQLHGLVRQARRHALVDAGPPGAAVRQARAHRELYRWLRAALQSGGSHHEATEESDR